ncbi:hypothetical protein bcgnr5390_64120 [Bacillus luti]|nr:hypothetical protein BC2903_62420 [Bacillus cereus]
MSFSKKRVAPMWSVGDFLFHYSDKERANKFADEENSVKEVFVGVDAGYFIGTVQPVNNFPGWIFEYESEANQLVSQFNCEELSQKVAFAETRISPDDLYMLD